MTSKTTTLLVLIAMTILIPSNAGAVGGKWTPEQVLELDRAWLAELGLELDPAALWTPGQGGLLEATVRINGCSSGFISAAGLLLTNHHCAFGILQEHSTPERDLIEEGFLAAGRGEELKGSNVRATLPHRFTDVTAEVEGAVPAGADDLARFKAIDRKKKELVAACEAQPFRRCQVATFDDGVSHVLFEALEYRDVRLVYTPPRWVGEYGGEVDNWTFPRHAGDFALLRVYADADGNPADPAATNVPYRPRHYLPIARHGVEEGDFVMILGYPGITYRSLVAEEMAERAELFFPRRAELLRAWIELLEEEAAKDPATAIVLAARIKGLANREKNARGQVKGIERGRLLVKKREHEAEVLAWVGRHPEHQAAVAAHAELSELVRVARATTWERDFLLAEAQVRGPLDLSLVMDLVRFAREREKPDLEREEGFQDRDRDRLRRAQERSQKELYPPAERRLLTDLVTRLAHLPENQRVQAVEALLGGDRSPAAIEQAVAKILANTRVHEAEARLAMFDESVEALRGRHDSFLDFALALTDDVLAMDERDKRHQGASSRLRPVWRRAVAAQRGGPLDPDANGTLRLSLAHVRGYRPRDAVWIEPFTRVAGVVEKHTGEDPFNAPAAVLAAAPAAPKSRWASPSLHDVPVCFLATGDTTGGSSGSPVINGRGELVGVNFDRVWENVANDFGYNPDIARNVAADVHYLLWLLEEVAGERSQAVLEELGVGR